MTSSRDQGPGYPAPGSGVGRGRGGGGIMIAQHWQLVITTKTVTAPLRTLARLHYWWYLARAQEAWEQRRHAVLRIMHSNDQSAVNWENAGTSGCTAALQHCSNDREVKQIGLFNSSSAHCRAVNRTSRNSTEPRESPNLGLLVGENTIINN